MLRAKNKQAEELSDWVCSEVRPSVRNLDHKSHKKRLNDLFIILVAKLNYITMR